MDISTWLSSTRKSKTIFDKDYKNIITRGEASHQVFTLPDLADNYGDIIISYTQGDFAWVTKSKTNGDLTLLDNTVSFNFTEAETAIFEAWKSVQCQVKLYTEENTSIDSIVLNLRVEESPNIAEVVSKSPVSIVGRANVVGDEIHYKRFRSINSGLGSYYKIACVFDSTWNSFTSISTPNISFIFTNEYGDGAIINSTDASIYTSANKTIYYIPIPALIVEKPGRVHLVISATNAISTKETSLSNSIIINKGTTAIGNSIVIMYGAMSLYTKTIVGEDVEYTLRDDLLDYISENTSSLVSTKVSLNQLNSGFGVKIAAGAKDAAYEEDPDPKNLTRQSLVFLIPNSITNVKITNCYPLELSSLTTTTDKVIYYCPTLIYDLDKDGSSYIIYGGN